MQCPRCEKDTVRGSRPRWFEQLYPRSLLAGPYRCTSCNHRFFLWHVKRSFLKLAVINIGVCLLAAVVVTQIFPPITPAILPKKEVQARKIGEKKLARQQQTEENAPEPAQFVKAMEKSILLRHQGKEAEEIIDQVGNEYKIPLREIAEEFRDIGAPVEEALKEWSKGENSQEILRKLKYQGIDIDKMVKKLERYGVPVQEMIKKGKDMQIRTDQAEAYKWKELLAR